MPDIKTLLPCPFCGHREAVEIVKERRYIPAYGGDFYSRCGNCSARGETCNSAAGASEAWNTRKGEV